MATVLNQNQDEDENSQNQGVVSSGESSQFAGGPAAQAAAPSARQPGSSGRFTNLSKYIQANNPSDLTNKVSGKVGEITGKAQGDLEKSKGQFQSDAEKTGQAVQQAQQGIQQGIQNISGSGDYNVSDEQFQQGLGQLQAAKNLQYTGPQGLSNEQNLAGQAQQLGSLGDATKTGGGRFALLQKFFNRPTYSTGQTNLDNLLLGSNNKALGDVRRTARSFGTELGQAQGQARTQIAGLQGDVANAQQAALTEAGNLAQGSLGDLGTELQNYYQSEQARKAAGAGIDPNAYNLTGAADIGRTFEDISKDPYRFFKPGQMSTVLNTRSEDFSLAGLNPEQLSKLGIADYTSDPLLAQYEQGGAGREALLGRANTTQTGQLNKLRELLGQGSIAGGEQLQQGAFNPNAARQTELQQGYNSILQQVLDQSRGTDETLLSNPIYKANKSGTYVPTSGYSADLRKQLAIAQSQKGVSALGQQAAQDETAIRNKINQDALARFRAQYGI